MSAAFIGVYRCASVAEKKLLPPMNTDGHRSRQRPFITVHHCSSPAKESFKTGDERRLTVIGKQNQDYPKTSFLFSFRVLRVLRGSCSFSTTEHTEHTEKHGKNRKPARTEPYLRTFTRFQRRYAKLKDATMGDRDYLIKSWREAREPMLELHAKIQKLEAELDKAVDAAWGEA
jgi:hypothetical protein